MGRQPVRWAWQTALCPPRWSPGNGASHLAKASALAWSRACESLRSGHRLRGQPGSRAPVWSWVLALTEFTASSRGHPAPPPGSCCSVQAAAAAAAGKSLPVGRGHAEGSSEVTDVQVGAGQALWEGSRGAVTQASTLEMGEGLCEWPQGLPGPRRLPEASRCRSQAFSPPGLDVPPKHSSAATSPDLLSTGRPLQLFVDMCRAQEHSGWVSFSLSPTHGRPASLLFSAETGPPACSDTGRPDRRFFLKPLCDIFLLLRFLIC